MGILQITLLMWLLEATFIPLVKHSPEPDLDTEKEESSDHQAEKNVACLVKMHTCFIPERLLQFEAVCAAVGMAGCFRAQETTPFTSTNLMQHFDFTGFCGPLALGLIAEATIILLKFCYM